jgi:hypothetical protein
MDAVDLQLAETSNTAQELQLRVEALGDAHVGEADLADEVQLLRLGHVQRARHLQFSRQRSRGQHPLHVPQGVRRAAVP